MLLRKVVRIEYYRRAHTGAMYGGGKNLHLECGHFVRRKQSESTPKRCRCVECEKDEHDKIIQASNAELSGPL